MFCLHVGDAPRKQAIELLEQPLFNPFILVTILANCAVMAWQSPLEPPGTWKSELVDQLDGAFLAIFTAEMLM